MPRFSPIFFMVICYVLGIVAVDFLKLSFWTPMVLLGLCLVLLIADLKYTFSFRPFLPYFSFFLLGLVLTTFLVHSLEKSSLLKLAEKETCLVISGEVGSEPKIEGERLAFVFEAEEAKTRSKTYKISELTKAVINKKKSPKEVKMGDKARVEGILSVPKNNSSSNQFDYKSYLYRQKIQTVFISTPEDLEIIQEGNFFYRQLRFLRDKIRKNAYRNLGCNEGGLLSAIVVGEKDKIPESVMNNFRDSGLAHVLVVSGLHVGLLAMTVWSLLKWVA